MLHIKKMLAIAVVLGTVFGGVVEGAGASRKRTRIAHKGASGGEAGSHGAGRVAKISRTDCVVDRALLRTLAEDNGLGYKTANLQMLADQCERLNQLGLSLHVAIPGFVGVPSRALVAALQPVRFNLEAAWRHVIATMPEGCEAWRSSLERRQVATMSSDGEEVTNFTPEFLAARVTFVRDLERQFDAWIARVSSDVRQTRASRVFFKTYFDVSELDNLIADAARNGERLMVRSTGKEDTETNANAGGNESVANVEPTISAVLAAMKRVVLSYFGERSLVQRLGAGDRSVFSGEVFIPVLVQKMVGEVASSAAMEMDEGVVGVAGGGAEPRSVAGLATPKVPRSGVMFTQDRESCAPGIMVVQATWGHNEGVVMSLVPVDTYRMSGTAIYPVVRRKYVRLVPGEEGLQRIANDKKLAGASTLTRPMLEALARVGQDLEHFYGYPLDIEFVISGKILYIVQARPLVARKGAVEPSYLDGAISGEKVPGSTLIAAGGAVRIIERPDQLVCATTLADALGDYQKPTVNRGNVQAVLVGEMAATTSHAATVFDGEGKPVVVVPAWEQLRDAVVAGKKLLVDVQRGEVWVVDSGFMSDAVIRPGWAVYPMPLELSVVLALALRNGGEAWTRKILADVAAPMELEEAQRFLDRHAREAWEGASGAPADGDIIMRHAAAAVRASEPEEVRRAAHNLEQQLIKMVRAYRTVLPVDQDLIADTDGLLLVVHQVLERLVNLAPDATNRMERLLHVRALQTLLRQQVDSEAVARPLSVARLVKVLRQERVLADAVAAIPAATRAKYLQLRKITTMIFVPEVQTQWEHVVRAAADDVAVMGRLSHLVASLARYDVLPTWLHTTFAADTKADAPARTLPVLLDTWETPLREDAEFLAALTAIKTQAKQVDLAAFGAIETFAKAWNSFTREIVDYFTTPDFATAFRAASPLAKNIACAVAGQVVDTFDLAIKRMKKSPALDPDRPALFQRMLKRYRDLFFAIADLVPAEAINYGRSPLQDYKNMINGVVDRASGFNEADLESTPGVNIPSFTIGSGMSLLSVVTRPSRGDDVFSITHQCILVALAALQKDQVFSIPSRLREVEVLLSEATCLSRQVTARGMLVHYNRPLRNHSCQFFAEYHAKTGRVDLMVQFYGHRPERWYHIGSMAVLLACAGVCEAKGFKFDEGVSFTLELLPATNLAEVQGMLTKMIEHANDERILPDVSDLVCRAAINMTPNAARAKMVQALRSSRDTWLDDGKMDIYQELKSKSSDDELLSYLRIIMLKAEHKVNILKFCIAIGKSQVITQLITFYVESLDHSPARRVRNVVFELVMAGYEPAYEVGCNEAIRWMYSPDRREERIVLELFSKLFAVSYQPAFVMACDVAVRGIFREEHGELPASWQLLNYLFHAKYQPAYVAAYDRAKQGILSADYNMQRGAIYLFQALINAKYQPAYVAARKAAEAGLASDDGDVRKHALKLQQALEAMGKEAGGAAAGGAAK